MKVNQQIKHVPVVYSGLSLDAFVTPDERQWVTLSSLARELGQHRQSLVNWLKRKAVPYNFQLPVNVGQRRVPTTAYPISIADDYLQYLAGRGDKQALALYSASFQADLERTITEATGGSVTPEAHEQRRVAIRKERLAQWALDYEEGGSKKKAFYQEASEQEVDAVQTLVTLERYKEALDKKGFMIGQHGLRGETPEDTRQRYQKHVRYEVGLLQKQGVDVPSWALLPEYFGTATPC